MHYPYTLKVNRLCTPMSLGVPASERENVQHVEISLWLHFEKPLPCWAEDDAGFINYADLCDKAIEHATSKPFKLIECFAMGLHAELRKVIEKTAGDAVGLIPLSVKMHKPNLPVSHTVQGASFYYSDLPAGASVSGVFE